jgi:hypothetical protein
MEGVQTIARTLAAAKSAAHDALAAAMGTYSESDYTGDDWAALNGFRTTGDTAIDEAADLAGVETAQSTAAAGMEGVQTIARTLAAAKSAAHDALAAALGINESSDTVDDRPALTESEVAGDTADGTETVVDQTEEPAAEDMPAAETGTEVADADLSQEIPATGDSTPDAAEEKTADLDPAPEHISPDVE